MARYLIYRPAEATLGGRFHSFFKGFISVHPGTAPRGYQKAQWDSMLGMLVREEDLAQCKKDLENLDETGWIVQKVEL